MMTRPWTNADDSNLILGYRVKKPMKDAAVEIGRTVEAMRRRAKILRNLGRLEPVVHFDPPQELADELYAMWNAAWPIMDILARLASAGHDQFTAPKFYMWIAARRVSGVPLKYRKGGKNRLTVFKSDEEMRFSIKDEKARLLALRTMVSISDYQFGKALRGRRFESLNVKPMAFVNILPPETIVLRTATAWE